MSKLLTLEDHVVIGTKQIHPLAYEINQKTEQICREFGIYYGTEDLFRERNYMMTYALPGGDPERLITLNIYNHVLWYIDDMYDRNQLNMAEHKAQLKQLYQNCCEIILTGKYPQEQHILYDVCMELYNRFQKQPAHPSWLPMFVDYTTAHLQSTTKGYEALLVDGKPSVERYIALREHDSGMYPTIYYVPFVYELNLSTDEIEAFKTINQLTAQVGSLSNDIFSYEKEVLRFGSKFNLIAVIQAAYNLSEEEAISEAIKIVNEKSRAFEAEYAALLAQPNLTPDQRLYIKGLHDICAATYYWQVSINRYRSINSPHPMLRQLLPVDELLTVNPV